MKGIRLLILGALLLGSARIWGDAESPAPAPMSPTVQLSEATQEAVEAHFQAARKLYLEGNRDGAMTELNEALHLNPYHPASAQLYETIRDEELSLRQVRLGGATPAPGEAPAQNSAPIAPYIPIRPDTSRGVLRGILAFDNRTEKHLDGLDKNVAGIGNAVNQIQTEVSGQKDMMSMLRDALKEVEGRQDEMMLGLIALMIALIVLLIMVIRLLSSLRRDVAHNEELLQIRQARSGGKR